MIAAPDGVVALFDPDAAGGCLYRTSLDDEVLLEWPVAAFDADGEPLIVRPGWKRLVFADSIPGFEGLDYKLGFSLNTDTIPQVTAAGAEAHLPAGAEVSA
jgi:hypothetical protein